MRPHVVVIHRWLARYAEYESYVDHVAHAVTYVTTSVGAPAVPASAAGIALVAATDDLPAVADRVKELAVEHGHPIAIVALKEDDLTVAAQLRTEWDCPGPTPADLLPFRDKLVMARRIASAGLAIPDFAPAPDVPSVIAFGETHGWPVVVKPRVGSASQSVSILDGPASVDALDLESDGPFLVQAFDSRPILHVDGHFDGREVECVRVSRYLNTCVGFRTGDVLGSVEVDAPDLVHRITTFTRDALAALTAHRTVFHLEVFADAESVAFLEVGARVGGAEIPFLWREVHGHDLMRTGFLLQMDQTPPPPPPDLGGEIGGWLLVPAPEERPCRITDVTSMTGRVPGPYAEGILRPGEILPAADAYYEHVGGRFRFRGASSAEVEEAITATARDFQVSAEPL